MGASQVQLRAAPALRTDPLRDPPQHENGRGSTRNRHETYVRCHGYMHHARTVNRASSHIDVSP